MSAGPGLLQLPPLSLYVHVPWCVRKCPYCDFNSHALRGEIPESLYLQALIADLEQELSGARQRKLHSIFIGGGTPSLMSGDFYRQLLSEIRGRIPFEDDIEITLEANPGTFEQQRFAGFAEAGINRLSLGIQSFSDDRLQALGRIHSADEAAAAVAAAGVLGFERINIDLMHGLPGQTLTQALHDLNRGIELGPTHLSWYQLTIEPNTEFHGRPPTLPEDEVLWSIQEQGQQLLAQAGYRQYEISAYSAPGQQSRHNLNYWRFGDYIGIGAGAHGKLTDPSAGVIRRRWKQRQPKAYMAALGSDLPVVNRAVGSQRLLKLTSPGSFLSGEEVIGRDALKLEFMMNALRLHDGVAAQLFSERTGLPLSDLQPQLAKAISLGLMSDDPSQLTPTEQGRQFLNDLLELFL